MKINELILGYEIQRTNEEQKLLSKLGLPVPIESLTEREEVILKTLERKNLVNTTKKDGSTFVKRNEYCHTPFKTAPE
jgi:hypothetical protein|tara:strand:- start:2616 stop:2849 length:234 start_codon:yes stop_codon:yes gene_type:complete